MSGQQTKERWARWIDRKEQREKYTDRQKDTIRVTEEQNRGKEKADG